MSKVDEEPFATGRLRDVWHRPARSHQRFEGGAGGPSIAGTIALRDMGYTVTFIVLGTRADLALHSFLHCDGTMTGLTQVVYDLFWWIVSPSLISVQGGYLGSVIGMGAPTSVF